MEFARQIALLPMFEGLPRAQHEDLAAIGVIKEYARGEIVFLEGAEASGFYVVLSGRVKIFKLSVEGKEQILHAFGPQESFGEAAVFSGKRFPAHAEALEACKTVFFPRQAFIDLVSKNPSLALNMLGVLARNLRRFAALVEDLSLKEVPGRLAAHLLYLSEKQGDTDTLALYLSKTQLAGMLGTIPETLSRILARMTREGLIESIDNRTIRLLDRESLEEISRGERRLT